MPNPKLETYKNKATGTVYDYTDAAAQASIAAIEEKIPDVASSENQLVTEAGLNNVLNFKEDKVPGKGLSTNDYDNTAKGIVDNIQSNVIANTKLIKDTVGWSGKNKWDKSKTTGIDATITQTSDGFRAQVSNHTWGSARCDFPTPAKNKDFILTCKANVATAGNFMKMQVYGSTDGSDYSNSIAVTDTYSATKELELAFNSGNYNYLRITLYLTNGTATSADVTFEKPMLRDANILDSTYEPYFGSTAFPRSEQAVLGAKNFLPIDIATLKAKNTTGTWSGNTYTLNGVSFECTVENGYVTDIATSGISSTEWVRFDLHRFVIPRGDYILSGITGGTSSTYRLGIQKHVSGSTDEIVYDGELNLHFDTDMDITVYIVVRQPNVNMDGKKFYPMLRLATDPDSTFAPFAMTNRELTEIVTPKTVPVTTDSKTFTKEGVYKYEAVIPVGSSSDISLPAEMENKGVTIVVRALNVGLPTAITIQQIAYVNNQGYFYMRPCNANNWGSWYKFTGTVVS